MKHRVEPLVAERQVRPVTAVVRRVSLRVRGAQAAALVRGCAMQVGEGVQVQYPIRVAPGGYHNAPIVPWAYRARLSHWWLRVLVHARPRAPALRGRPNHGDSYLASRGRPNRTCLAH